MRIEKKPNKVRIVDHIAMFLLGIINNMPYVIALASADRVVAAYNNPTYLGLVTFADTISGIFSRFLNTWLLTFNISYEINFIVNCVLMLIGLLGCGFSKTFWLTFFAVFFIGYSCNLGESILLGYMPHRRKQVLLKSWSSGTGMAGILGAGYSLLTALCNVSLYWSFIGISPVVVIYFICFFLVVRLSPEEDPEGETTAENEEPASASQSSASSSEKVKIDIENDDDITVEVGKKVSVWDCATFRKAWSFFLNCGLVYFFEYCITSVFTHCSASDAEIEKYPYIYPLLNLMYQCGVFISRSSIIWFRFPWITALTITQGCLFVLWFANAFLKFMPFPALVPVMIIVGLMGGCSYVNVFHLIMTDDSFNTLEKEIATNWNAFFVAVFIVLSSIFTFASEMTYLKKYINK